MRELAHVPTRPAGRAEGLRRQAQPGATRRFPAQADGSPKALCGRTVLSCWRRPQARRQLWPMAAYLRPQGPASNAARAASAAAGSTAR
jgi:hypothetical protein